jgi:hypothetical protein
MELPVNPPILPMLAKRVSELGLDSNTLSTFRFEA